ncbi:MAG TPA: hypothetical protein VNV82_02325 [Bryobacteraceae bacterium]|jgi:hypothetical protein|nr:hypothetical protein [Bryobacteraceae bacterium]
MTNDDLFKFVIGIPTIIVSLFTLFNVLLPAIRWRNQTRMRVGSPGTVYDVAVTYPLRIVLILLTLTILAMFAMLLLGAMLVAHTGSPSLGKYAFFFDYPHIVWIAVSIGVLTLLVYFNPIPRFLVWFTYWLDHFRFTHGWANAKWQLSHYKTFFAMGLNEEQIERLANGLAAEVIKRGQAFQPDQIPQPVGLSPTEQANYLMIGCVIEEHLHRLYKNERQRLVETWNYLANVAVVASRPFSPPFLLVHAKTNAYFDQLKSALTISPAQAALPQDPVIRQSVNEVASWLARKMKGDGARLAVAWPSGASSVAALSRRLAALKEFQGGMLRVFIKVSFRMGIWRDMYAGPFLYAYSDGLATLLMNAGCLVPPSDNKEIETDQIFKDLVAGAEDTVISRALQAFAQPPSPTEAAEAARRIFGVASPADVETWRFQDYADLFLWGHAREFCVKRLHTTGANIGCELATSASGCACDRTDQTWVRQDGVLIRREVK